nr:Bcl2 associated athanogene 1 [Hymenolepis microstoma]
MYFYAVVLFDGIPNNISFVQRADATVGDLHSEIESKLNVKRSDYILTFWDVKLDDEAASLSAYNITSGSILLATTKDCADPNEIKKLDQLEDSIITIQAKLACLQINSDFLSLINSSPNAVATQSKDLLKVSENCMKNLELADSVVLPSSDHNQRKRRKQIVNTLNVC